MKSAEVFEPFWSLIVYRLILSNHMITISNLIVVVVQILIVLLAVVLSQKLLPVGMEAVTA